MYFDFCHFAKPQTVGGYQILMYLPMKTEENNLPSEYVNGRIAVPAEFATVFSHFYFAANHSPSPVTSRLLPSYQSLLVFCFAGPVMLRTEQSLAITEGKCLVLGPVKQAFEYTLAAGAEMLVANFKADAFHRFFGEVLLRHHLVANPDDLIGEHCFEALCRSLKSLSAAEQVDVVLQFCRPYLKQRKVVSGKLADFDNDALDPIKLLAGQIGQSQRNIQLIHKKQLGYSAKEHHRYRRFMKAVALTQSLHAGNRKIDWSEVIGQCGYYDQSQLIHDFRHFTGITPRQFLRFQATICSAAPGA